MHIITLVNDILNHFEAVLSFIKIIKYFLLDQGHSVPD